MAKQPRIFVNIASYRDPDCQWTVKDMFEKAKHPERVFAGICWQYVKGEDDLCFKEPYPRPKQVRVHEMDAREAKGVCYARNLVQKLCKDEEFTLQIDSHMRFEQDWDDLLLSMWRDCANDKAVLTAYPPGYTPPDKLERKFIYGMAAKHFDEHGILLMHGKPNFPLEKLPEKPIPGAFASACMLFGPSSINQDVPYDPNLYFFGEEISLAVRLWTHGYDLYHPNKPVIYHDWDRTKRKTHFDDHPNRWPEQNKLAFARVRHMLGVEPSKDKTVTKDLDKYGLGDARTLSDYEAFSGVKFSDKKIAPKALSGRYTLLGAEGDKAKAPRIFVALQSFRDRRCQWAVKDLFEKANNPDRVFVGICWQFDEQEDKDCFQVSTRPDQVRVFPIDWRESRGNAWALEQAQSLWDNEEYRLVIDTTLKFQPGWDDAIAADHVPGSTITSLLPYREPLPPAPKGEQADTFAIRGKHKPVMVRNTPQAIVIDNFLPEDVYQRVHAYALKTDYETINAKGKVSRAWHPQDNHPVRSTLNLFYYAPSHEKPKGDYVYPTKTGLDEFVDHLLAVQPKVERITGRHDKDWAHVTATCWGYPPNTGLAMHDDGSGVYSGAYVYFLNPYWRAHWGGLLIMMDQECNQRVHEYRNSHDQMDFYKLQWLNANGLDDLLMEHGMGTCILPKRNRIVFIANDAYHMVTRVNEQAGDNVRLSIAGFFNRPKAKATGNDGNY